MILDRVSLPISSLAVDPSGWIWTTLNLEFVGLAVDITSRDHSTDNDIVARVQVVACTEHLRFQTKFDIISRSTVGNCEPNRPGAERGR